jgi:hypothetical protein
MCGKISALKFPLAMIGALLFSFAVAKAPFVVVTKGGQNLPDSLAEEIKALISEVARSRNVDWQW